MEYATPEVVVVGEAIETIQGGKPLGSLEPPPGANPAYDLDE